MKKVFFVSRLFPFHLVIYPGSGPGFGRAVSKALCLPLPAQDDAARRRRDSLTWSHTLSALCDGIERLAAP